MKHMIRIIMSVLLLVTSFSVCPSQMLTIEAKEDYSDYYPMSCTAYEVDEVTSAGSFTKKGCYDTFSKAKTAMNQGGNNTVIRHPSSYSPSKVIAMASGVAYSYPQRSNANIARVYQTEDYSYAMMNTYVTVHREMAYEETVSYKPSTGNGVVHVVLNGFDGYMDLKNMDLVPMRFITSHQKIWLGGNSEYDHEEPFFTYVYQGYYKVEKSGKYTDLVYHCRSGYSLDDPVEWTFDVSPAADWMQIGDVYYTKDGCNLYHDRRCTDMAGVYYPYYQFETLRTRSYIDASVYNTFLKQKNKTSGKLWNTGGIFLECQEKYGINALLVFALACLESAYGTSQFAMQRNNLFGWNAVDSDPGQASYFSSIEQAINEHMGINLREYTSVNDARFFGAHLGNKGSGINVKYAGDNYWGMKISAIAYEIDKCSRNYDGTLTDFDSAQLGVIADDVNVNVRAKNSTSSAILYNTAFGDNDVYQQNFTVSILGQKDGWYQVQSNNYLENGVVKMIAGVGYLTWDWEHYRGWIRSDLVQLINTCKEPILGRPKVKLENPTLYRTLDDVSYVSDSTVRFRGIALIRGLEADEISELSASLVLQDTETGAETVFEAVLNDGKKLDLGDRHSYSRIYYTVDVPVASIEAGNYDVKMRVINDDNTAEKLLYGSAETGNLEPKKTGNGLLRVFADVMAEGRMQVSLEPSDLDFGVINKPQNSVSPAGGTFSFSGSLLSFDGFGMIQDTGMDERDHPVHTLILLSSGGKSYRVSSVNKACPADLAGLRGSDDPASHACFDATYDLSSLAKGRYRIYLDISTDEAEDLLELTDIREPDMIESVSGGRTYRIFTEKTRSRYILEIS